jgi:ABC-type multidrug transport system fused ATPase/permease subunit
MWGKWGTRWVSTKTSTSGLMSLWRLIAPEKKHLTGAVGAVCLTSAGTVSFPYFTGKLMDGFAQSSQSVSPDVWMDVVHNNAFACLGALALVGGGGFIRAYLLETASEKISKRLRMDLFRSMLGKSQTFFDSARTGDLVSRLGSDVTRVSKSVMDGAFGVRVLINAGAGTVMVVNSVPLTIVPQLLAPVGLMFVGGVIYGRFVKHIAKRQTEALAESMHVAEENLSLIKTVKLLNGESRALSDYNSSLESIYSLAQKSALGNGGKVAAFVTIGGGFILHVVYNCGMLISGGVLTLGQTSALAGYLLVCGNAYQGLMTSYGDIQKAIGACNRILAIRYDEEPISHKTHPVLFTSAPSVTFENITFGYTATSAPVLNGFNLFVPSRAKQAIVGLSGSGKSSVLMLLAKLYEPTTGRVMINDVDLASIDPGDLRSNVLAIVPQDNALFNRSVRDNIWYPQLDCGGELADLTKRARLGFVSDWNANVGERGQNLSGGERQRIAIARALARNKNLLLLDEATSALDSQSDQAILDNMRTNQSATVLTVTHRLSAIEWSDRLCVIANGRVAENGDTANLLRNPGPELRTLLAQLERTSR